MSMEWYWKDGESHDEWMARRVKLWDKHRKKLLKAMREDRRARLQLRAQRERGRRYEPNNH